MVWFGLVWLFGGGGGHVGCVGQGLNSGKEGKNRDENGCTDIEWVLVESEECPEMEISQKEIEIIQH